MAFPSSVLKALIAPASGLASLIIEILSTEPRVNAPFFGNKNPNSSPAPVTRNKNIVNFIFFYSLREN